MQFHKNTRATFRPLDNQVGQTLANFADNRRNIGKSVEIDGVEYILDHISRSTSSFFRSRGISIYFRTKQSVVRISDHWTATRHQPRSRKFNCGSISSCRWSVHDRKDSAFETRIQGGRKYPHRMIAGICALRSFKSMPGCENA